ncbi:MAG: hypothetical protein A2W17_07475 [Planctomycetes bacterium RBG_16_41_13]|nr:MAG: hypothetical protein A2W17_07475 [Planctomycetes bacterium RBG_16_41_13]
MKIFCKYVFIVFFVLFLFSVSSYANNTKFNGTYSGNLSNGMEFSFTFGNDKNSKNDGNYIYLPKNNSFHVYEGVDDDNDTFTVTIIIKGRTIYYSKIGQYDTKPDYGWADYIKMKFDKKYNSVRLNGFEIVEDDSGDADETAIKGTLYEE